MQYKGTKISFISLMLGGQFIGYQVFFDSSEFPQFSVCQEYIREYHENEGGAIYISSHNPLECKKEIFVEGIGSTISTD